MKISIIVAVSQNNVIGVQGKLPWRLSDDLKNFKQLTSGHCILMGRKTYESIGKPLPNRVNLILSQMIDYQVDNCFVFKYFHQATAFALAQEETELFVIGGGEIYKEILPLADKIYLTSVKVELEGDTFFPKLNPNEWQEIKRENFEANEKNDFDFDVIELLRV